MARSFRDLLGKQWDDGKFLCVGLDSDLEKIPEAAQQENTRETIVAFNRAIVDATKEVACAFKLNPAFYEAHGDEGYAAMRETIAYILEVAGDCAVIFDGKRGDILNSNKLYAFAAFEHLRADAVTVNPYSGRDALAPFLEREDKGVIVWCRTSNEGAAEFQDLKIGGEQLYKVVARHAVEWNKKGNCGLVVGATYPEELAAVRAIVGDMPVLVPGIGAQNGDLRKAVQAGLDRMRRGLIINASRSIIFASNGPDFAEAAGKKAGELHAVIMEGF